MERSAHKLQLLERISELERNGLWHMDADEDPETLPLLPDDVDYLHKKLSTRIKNRIANRMGTKFFDGLIEKRQLIIKEVRGIENYTAVKGGCFVTCNHFSICDHYAVWVALRDAMNRRMLYKIIREGNYTNPPGGFGFLMRNCNTLPLASRMDTMKKLMQAISVLTERGETILIYPEQGMWWNYRKPRPMQNGAFTLAVRSRTPVVPIFITMDDSDVLDGDGFPVQEYTLHILPAIYPDETLSRTEARDKMMSENYAAWVKVYEEFYGIPLKYADNGGRS